MFLFVDHSQFVFFQGIIKYNPLFDPLSMFLFVDLSQIVFY